MRKQTEFRAYPPISGSAGWGAGNNENKRNDKGGQTEQKPAARTFVSHSRRIAAVLVACLTLLTATRALAGSPKLAKDLEAMDAADQVHVIIQFKQAPTERHHQKIRDRGGVVRGKLDVIKGGAYTLPASALNDLANDDEVAYISPDRKVGVLLDNTAAAVNAAAAWQAGYNGTGIGVAVIDSGIAPSDLFMTGATPGTGQNRVVYNQDFTTDTSRGDLDLSDAYGHGTHVAGIIGARSSSSVLGYSGGRNLRGIAPGVSLINLRVLGADGSGTDSSVIAAIQQAIALKSAYNIRVINLSLGRPVSESYKLDPLCQAVEQAWNAGIVVVVAAGNQGRNNNGGIGGYGTITAPGNDPYVITVGAMKTGGTPTRNDDLIASYSSKGPTLYDHVVKPDLVAPGNLVVSLCPAGSFNSGVSLWDTYASTQILTTYYDPSAWPGLDTWYYTLSGTSMAAPVVSGAVADLLQQHPSLTPDQVKARLMKTAYKLFPHYSTATDPTTGISYTDQYDIFTVGAGYLDIQAALANNNLASSTVGSALSPSVTEDASGNFVLVNGTSVIWGGSVMWGTSVVWGTSVLWGTDVQGNSVLWGSSVVWGTSSMQGYSVLWGTGTNGTINPATVVWGTSTGMVDGTAVLTLGEK
jgi:serine protease AprX